jgi:rRNA maturation endonuclease Nob1
MYCNNCDKDFNHVSQKEFEYCPYCGEELDAERNEEEEDESA